jgi:hypothetical protein
MTSLRPAGLAPLPTDAEKEEALLRAAVEKGGLMTGLPAPIEQAFRQHYQARVIGLLRKYIHGLILLHCTALLPIALFWKDPSFKPWALFTGLPIALAITGLWIASRLRNLERHADVIIGGCLFMALASALFSTMYLDGQYFGALSKYEVVYTFIVAFTILQVPVRIVTPVALGALLVALAAAVPLQAVPFWLEVCMYFALPLTLCTVTGYILETSEKRNFLQYELIQRESRRLAELNAIAEENIRQQRRSAEYLAMISGNLALKELLTRTLRFLVDHTGAQVAAAYHLSARGKLRRVATWAVDAERLAERREIEPGATLMGPALETGELLHLPHIRADYLPIQLGMGTLPCAALLVIPVVQAGRPLAVIELGRLEPFSAQHMAIADSIRLHLAYAVAAANARELAVRSSATRADGHAV